MGHVGNQADKDLNVNILRGGFRRGGRGGLVKPSECLGWVGELGSVSRDHQEVLFAESYRETKLPSNFPGSWRALCRDRSAASETLSGGHSGAFGRLVSGKICGQDKVVWPI